MSRKEEISYHFAEIMKRLGLDLRDPSLKDTPNRVAKMYVDELFWGLDISKHPKMTTFPKAHGMDQMIVIKDIKVNSMCEHHFMPFVGVAHIGYIPNEKVLGLSKFNRYVDYISRRPQIQENLTYAIATGLQEILDTNDVAVVLQAQHMCVKIRGIQDQNSITMTSSLNGAFLDNIDTRNEFMNYIN